MTGQVTIGRAAIGATPWPGASGAVSIAPGRIARPRAEAARTDAAATRPRSGWMGG